MLSYPSVDIFLIAFHRDSQVTTMLKELSQDCPPNAVSACTATWSEALRLSFPEARFSISNMEIISGIYLIQFHEW